MSVRGMQWVSAHIEYINPKSKKTKIECREDYSKICQYNKSEHYLSKCVENRCKYYGHLFEDKANEKLKDKSKDKPKEKVKDKSSGRNIDRSTHPYLYKNIIMVSLAKQDANEKIAENYKERNLKYEYKVNTNILIGKLISMISLNNSWKRSQILQEITKNMVHIRPDRSFDRKIINQLKCLIKWIKKSLIIKKKTL